MKNEGTAADTEASLDIGRLLDVDVELTAELGRKHMRIADVLGLSAGSTIELPKSAEELLDIRVNGKLVARGEAVVLGDRYGVRIVEVLGAEQSRGRGAA